MRDYSQDYVPEGWNQDSKQFLLTVNKCLLGTSHVPEIGDTTVSKKQGHGLLIVYSLVGT